MRKQAGLVRRLADVAALQTLKADASRTELATARALRADAEQALAAADRGFAGGMREMESVLASEVLDFDRWRIGRALFEELAVARDAAADTVSRREETEEEAQTAVRRERAREEQAVGIHRKLARALADKRDEAATLEANGLATARRLMRQA
ncbi:MAG: hypothetical protein P0Y56_14010 [Candidatus Andeanibacterium colombiense]|uniref:Flagellar FliJ protein n=1 Tax=Candidatus Andeanibacterium colombiense TaxID=3121345 RepID=A0AAJ6BP70_9SPHN|nr:MAG: hypothetical protein P0Y56_14010 [Sphingomonadaceae bacterium]